MKTNPGSTVVVVVDCVVVVVVDSVVVVIVVGGVLVAGLVTLVMHRSGPGWLQFIIFISNSNPSGQAFGMWTPSMHK